MEYKDYYKVMGLERNAGADDIRKAYRRLARRYHPDVSKEAGAEARFKELGEAYEVLKDPEKRAAYDELGANWQAGQEFRPPPGWQAGRERAGRGGSGGGGPGAEDFSDFFESLFRREFGGGSGSGSNRPGAEGMGGFQSRGEDHHAKIEIDLEDAYQGATRALSLRVPEVDAQGRVQMREHQIEFTIPKGVRAGQNIRLAGQGAPGFGNGPRGDLYLELSFRPHPRFRVELRDVFMDLPVAPWEAALGAKVEAPVPGGGSVELTIPPGSASGRKLRLKGRGIPGSTPGDFYFVLRIMLPPARSEAARALYGEMAKQFADFRPREHLATA